METVPAITLLAISRNMERDFFLLSLNRMNVFQNCS